MKKILYAAALSLLVFNSSCRRAEKEATADTPDAVPQQTDASGPQPSTTPLNRNDTLRLNGHTYIVSLQRASDGSLPTVTDEFDTEFYDNAVAARIACDGTEVFSHRFTKADFASHLSAAEQRGSVFQGMALARTQTAAGVLCFGAQVGLPGLDGEGPAFTISVSLRGDQGFNIRRDLNPDTTRDDMGESATD